MLAAPVLLFIVMAIELVSHANITMVLSLRLSLDLVEFQDSMKYNILSVQFPLCRV